MINADLIQELKNTTNLVQLFKEYGMEAKKQGKNYKVICPFHEDEEPSLSINVEKKLWQCFGCGTGGDAIKLVQDIENIGFVEAVGKLAKQAGRLEDLKLGGLADKEEKPVLEYQLKEKNIPNNYQQNISLTDEDLQLLKKVSGFYHRRFLDLNEGKAYLRKRGLFDSAQRSEQIFKEYQIGYAEGSLLTALPKDYIPKLKKLDILLESGKERFINCVVFPLFDYDGNVVSFYGRHIKMDSGGHFYLPGQKRGLFNRERIKQEMLRHAQQPIIITESIIDSLSFINKGIENVLSLYGVNGFTEEHRQLIEELQPEEIILALDGEEWGQNATEYLIQEKLFFLAGGSRRYNCHILVSIFPNNMDANEWFRNHTKEEFYKLLNEGYLLQEDHQKSQSQDKLSSPINPSPLNIQLKHIDNRNGKLSVTLKADNKNKFILDTYNLYSSKQRETLINELVKLYKIKKEEAEKEVNKLIEVAENKKVTKNTQVEVEKQEIIISADDKVEAIAFLKSPDLLTKIVQDYEDIGYTGEEMNKKLAYLVMTSRKMQSPLSLVIMSNSAAGKSSLQQATLELCPDEDKKHFTRLTQQSLYYLGDDSLKHKFLSIEEEEGSSEASYSLKTLLSAKVLQVISTTHDPNTGKKRADEYKTEGPVAVMVSTTSPEIEAELASRTLIISIDESHEQTNSIHLKQRNKRELDGRKKKAKKETAICRHMNAQRLLDINLEVVNNYATQLTFPVDRLKYRRGNEHYLDLIDTIAFLRQKQKEIKKDEDIGEYIEVDKADIELANKLFTEIMGWYVSELKKPTKVLLKMIIDLCKQKEEWIFSRRELREYGKYSTGHLHRHLKKLEELEYIISVSGANGSKYMYRLMYEGDLNEEEKFVLGLKDVSEL